jgi:hypothetical protein
MLVLVALLAPVAADLPARVPVFRAARLAGEGCAVRAIGVTQSVHG